MVTRYWYSQTVKLSDEQMKELAFVCRTQDNELLEEIAHMIGDNNITSAQFRTDNGDIEEDLHVRYIQPSYAYDKTWQRVYSCDSAEEYLDAVLPHGSGINATWQYETRGNIVIASNVYSHMNSVGFYDGDIPFKVYLRKYPTRELNSNFEVQKITLGLKSFYTTDDEGNEYNDIDEVRSYLEDTFGLSC